VTSAAPDRRSRRGYRETHKWHTGDPGATQLDLSHTPWAGDVSPASLQPDLTTPHFLSVCLKIETVCLAASKYVHSHSIVDLDLDDSGN
jgi:hypothetical protein